MCTCVSSALPGWLVGWLFGVTCYFLLVLLLFVVCTVAKARKAVSRRVCVIPNAVTYGDENPRLSDSDKRQSKIKCIIVHSSGVEVLFLAAVGYGVRRRVYVFTYSILVQL